MEKIILGLKIVILILILVLIVGMLVLSVAAVAMAKASSAEELAAAAQAFNEAQQEGRLMEWFILSLSIVLPLLMVGMCVSSWAAAVLAKESSAEVLAAGSAGGPFEEVDRDSYLDGLGSVDRDPYLDGRPARPVGVGRCDGQGAQR